MHAVMAAEAGTTAGEALNTGLTSSISGSAILSNFIAILPWVAGMVGVSFVIYEARKLIKGTAKGKVRV